MDTESAELDARRAEATAKCAEAVARESAALEASAISQLNIQRVSLETQRLSMSAQELARSAPGSPRSVTDSGSSGGRRSPRTTETSDLVALLRHFDAQRRDDQRIHEAQLAATLAAVAALGQSKTRYIPGAAVAAFRTFDGAPADGATYLVELTDLLGAHQIPQSEWPRELRLKLGGTAVSWYKTQFKGMDADTFPPWGDLCAALLQEYSPLYKAAEAYHNLESAVRLPGQTGPQALQHIASLTLLLERCGVSTPGPNERLSYRYQQLLTPAEHDRWTSLASADPQISEKHLNELELHSSSAPSSGRLSCSPETREAFFLGRVDHLRNFLREQGAAPSKSCPPGPARAAVSQSTFDNSFDTPTSPPGGASPPRPACPNLTLGDRRDRDHMAAQVHALKAKWTARSNRNPDTPPPCYHGPDPTHLT